MIAKVGLLTISFTPRASANPCTKQVLPLPKSPCNARTAPGLSSFASSTARFFVSSGDFVIFSIRVNTARFTRDAENAEAKTFMVSANSALALA